MSDEGKYWDESIFGVDPAFPKGNAVMITGSKRVIIKNLKISISVENPTPQTFAERMKFRRQLQKEKESKKER